MTYQQLAYVHLATILPAAMIGALMLARPKGTRPHRVLGRVYLTLIVVTGLITLFMPAQVGPRVFGHFGFIHVFSVVALFSAPQAYLAARRGDVRTHRGAMLGLYVGGILIAGSFALMPGRMLHDWLF